MPKTRWRRWLAAVAVAIAVHGAMVAAFLTTRSPSAPEQPPLMVELMPLTREPTPEQPTPRPRAAESKASPIAPALAPRPTPVPEPEVRPAAPAPAPTPSRPAQAAPRPLYASPTAKTRSCVERNPTAEERERCNRMGLAMADRFKVPPGAVVPSPASPDPEREPIKILGAEVSVGPLPNWPDAVGITLKWKF